MKKIILTLSCLAFVLGGVSTSFSTPDQDFNANTEEILALNNSIMPLNFTASANTGVSFDGIYLVPDANVSARNSMNYTSRWAPRWFSRSNWNNFKSNFFNSYNLPPRNGNEGSSNPVPEPATILLLGSGLFGLAFIRRKKIES